MSERSFAKFKLISIAVFIFGLVSAALAFSFHQVNGKKVRHAKGFTLITRDTAMPFTWSPDGPNIIKYSICVRYKKSDGPWKQVRKYYNSKDEVVKKDIGVGIPGQGVFKVDIANRVLEFLSSMPPVEKTSYVPINDGHDHPNFLKDDLVHGYQTYVLRFPDQDGGYLDIYFAPELDDTPIREVSVSPLGTGITELIDIKMGDPDERVFSGLSKWLVSYDRFKWKIATMEEAGKHEAAESLRKELAEQIAKEDRKQ